MARGKRIEDEALVDVPAKRIRLTAPHAYYTASNELKSWHVGQVVDGEEAAHLIGRKAHHEEVS